MQRAKALVVIGEVNSSRGKNHLDTARDALTRAYDMLQAMGAAPGVDAGEYYKTLGASAFWLGQIAYDASRLDEASKQMTRYREASERWLAAAPGNAHARAELGYALGSLSSIAMKRGRWEEAQRGFEASLALKLAVLKDHPGDLEAQDAIASARAWLGQLAHLLGQPAKALALYDQARAVQLQLMKDRPGEAVRLYDLGVMESRRAEALQALGRKRDTVEAREAAIAWVDKALVNGSTNRFWQAERLHADSALLLAKVEAGLAIDQGVAALRGRMAGQEQEQVRQANLTLWRRTVATAHLVDAMQAARERAWQRSRGSANTAAQELDALIAQHPTIWQLRELQARTALLLMRVHAGASATTELAAHCTTTRAALQPAIESGQAGFVLEAWLAAGACAGGAIATGDLQKLMAGGYRPQSTEILINFKQGMDHDDSNGRDNTHFSKLH